MLQAGASLCILLAAAFTASIPLFPAAAEVAAARCNLGEAGPSAGVVLADGAVTLILLSSGFHKKVASPSSSPVLPTVGLSNT